MYYTLSLPCFLDITYEKKIGFPSGICLWNAKQKQTIFFVSPSTNRCRWENWHFWTKISNNLLPPNPSIDCQSTTDQVSTSVHWISNECRSTIDQVLIDNKLIYQQTYWLRLPIINMTRLVSDIVKSYPGFYRIQITGVFWLLPRYNPNQLFWIIPNNSHTDSNTWVERNTRLQYSDEPGRLNSRVSVSLMYSILTPV